MPRPDNLAYMYKARTVIAETPTTRAKALEIARLNFPQLRNVEDERIHFAMQRQLNATFKQTSRISPTIWESFFQKLTAKPEDGYTVLVIEVDRLPWAGRLGFGKDKKNQAKEEKKENDAGVGLPAYSKTTAWKD